MLHIPSNQRYEGHKIPKGLLSDISNMLGIHEAWLSDSLPVTEELFKISLNAPEKSDELLEKLIFGQNG
jgi:hypothetical protein